MNRLPFSVRPARLLVLLAYLGFLTWASLAPAKVIANFPFSFPYADKLFHFLIYGGLVAVARWTFATSRLSQLSTFNPQLLFIAIAYGGFMELLQSFLVSYGRSFELLDVVANTLGALAFWLLTASRAKPSG